MASKTDADATLYEHRLVQCCDEISGVDYENDEEIDVS